MPDLENNEAAEQEQEQQEAAPVTDAETEAEGADESGEEAEQNRADSAAAEEGEQAEDGEEEQPEKKKGGFQRKIDKLTARTARLKQEAEYWRQKALRTTPSASTDGRKTDATTEKVADPGAKPKTADFETWDAYDAAVAEWLEKKARYVATTEVEAVERKRTQAEQERQRASTDSALEEKLEKREEAALTKFPDFLDASEAMFDTLAPLQGKPGCAFIARACMHEDPDGRLEHYLGTHPQEAVSIARMSETAAAVAIGKIVASKLAPQKSAAASATASKAPPPPKTLQKSSPTQTGLSDDLSDEEWLRRRNAQLRRKH